MALVQIVIGRKTTNEHDTPGWSLNHRSVKDELREIWADILHDDPTMFTDDDIFFEVGGDSVTAQRLITAAQGRGIRLSMEQIFKHASLAEMADIAEAMGSSSKERDLSLTDAAQPLSSHGRKMSLNGEIESIARACNVATGDVEAAYPCSPMQEALMTELDGEKNRYMRQFVFRLSKEVNLGCFRQAWHETIRANPVLRTRIHHLGAGVGYVQAVLRTDGHWNTLNVDLNHFLQWDATNHMLMGDLFFRYAVVVDQDRKGNVRRHFVWTVHHALCDGASIPEIFANVARRYHNKPVSMREPFESFIWSPAIKPDQSAEQSYWRRTLSDMNPTSYPSIPQDSAYRAAPSSVLERLLRVDVHPPYGVTRALFLRAAWAILLSHYNGMEDVGFGAINNGRTSAVPGVSQMTGPTINLVPIALRVDAKESVASFLSRVRLHAAEMMPFEHTGISRIRKHLAGTDSTAVDFQTLFVVHPMNFNEAIERATKPLGLEYIDELGKKEQHSYPLVVTLTLSSGSDVSLMLQYDERVVSAQQADNITHQFQVLLTRLSTATRDTTLSSISSFSDNDKRQIQQWNGFTPPVEDTCIHHLFRKQVIKQPSAVAVCSLEESLTYLDVDTYSSSLAGKLAELGVSTGTFVGVCFEKSAWTVIAILAIFKAGGVYVPIDPAHPQGRIEEVIKTVGIEITLASRIGTEVLTGLCRQIFTYNGRFTAPICGTKTPSNSRPSSTAYLLFTSGSTGKPKAILMSHTAISTSIIHHGAAFAAGPHWRTLQFGAHTFDLSIGEFFTTLAHGGCICVPSEEDRLNDLAGAITSLNANTLLVVPTVANLLFPKDVPTLKTIVLAGEPITKETVVRWADAVDLTCAYGPSETAVWCSGNLRVAAHAHPGNIGRSIGATMWIVNPDNYHQLSAIGCVGEIVISGALLGGGYFGDRAITDAAWVPAPAWMQELKSCLSPYDMLYRSGDLARYNPDGTFQIVGRRDTQVKLRGFRIELGEIENQIMATGRVTAALACLPEQGPCARHIVAVVCSTKLNLMTDRGRFEIAVLKNEQSSVERLKALVSLTLPEYMIPTVWIVLAKMPLLVSGKVDRKLIKSWVGSMESTVYQNLVEEPSTDKVVEITPGSLADKLRHLWSSTLNMPVEQIGMNSSFIALGGDSIAAIQIASRAKELGLSVTVRGIVSTKTLGKLVALVDQNTTSSTMKDLEISQDSAHDPEIPLAFKHILQSRLAGKSSVHMEYAYILAPFQREIMKARKINPGVFLLSWQMEIFSRSSHPISLERLAESWKRVVRKYPIMRSIFLQAPAEQLPAVQVVLAKSAEPEVAILSASAEEPEPSFTTAKLPPVDECLLPHRAHFYRHGDRIFAHVELDHLVIDGWSLKPIKEALLAAYDDEAHVPEEPPSYKTFVAAFRPDRVERDNQHWRSALSDHSPSVLSLPVISCEETPRQPSLEKTILYLPEIAAQALKAFSVQNGITPASIFDAAWAQTLSAYTGSSDVTFEYVVSGRDEDVPGIFDIVGPLINVLPYHLNGVSKTANPKELAQLAQMMQEQRAEDTLHASSNVREVIETELGDKVLFNTALNFQRRPTAIQTDTLRIDDDLRKSRDPWHFNVLVRVMHITDDDTFKSSFEFDARFFEGARMNEVAEDFWGRIQNILA